MGRFFVITGLNNGNWIKPFIVTEKELDNALIERGDSCRRYTPFNTRHEAEVWMNNPENAHSL